MSGHSKWSTIKRKKGAADAKRGQIFTRMMREITVAAKSGGGDVEGNPRLRTAVAAAKAQNMPKDNIERAIKKGTGELEGVTYEEITYEGYGPGGVAFLIECLTDNKNRAASEIRHILTKRGGSLAKAGAVGYLFEAKGIITFEKDAVDEDTLMEAALEAGAEDVVDEGDVWEVHTSPSDFNTVNEALAEAGLEPVEAEITKQSSTTVEVTDKGEAAKIMALMEALDEADDAQNVYSNFDIDEALLADLDE
ncbi:MAG: YebC/PmpR family DNA-binding transcriptional regulator [Desulfarculaceae bacterium]|nr:YebC/PmpR family DNA-binding transcriptional regulator [Desulfarculaceae bacterium]MCF8072734.1 YebC/PmpR family DNA-binding transcriptional regulator [Desulfarculaceae bacterium]MCF8103032.1 YebC/PmpR family DNA-binding transcriptional regulator [Desulfarculaceae bacterium]MCF8118103.1 YebC/PmpR family DNA-binding transcriptional regulator [Desulfarculaceae bacterium]